MGRWSGGLARSGGLALGLLGCGQPEEIPHAGPGSLRLWWPQGYDQDLPAEIHEGLSWDLTLMGLLPSQTIRAAEILPGGMAWEVQWDPEDGGPGAALEARVGGWRGESWYLTGWGGAPGVDAGRFLASTLWEPAAYYHITGACPQLSGWLPRLGSAPLDYAVTDSLLVEGDRWLRYRPPPADTSPADTSPAAWVAILAAEGEGSVAARTFRAHSYETVDWLPSGQQRFAVYDTDGQLTHGGEVSGPPGRCMWCHEGSLQPLRTESDPVWEQVGGFVDTATARADLTAMQAAADALRADLAASGEPLDYANPKIHAWGERLGELFYHPTPARVAREWGTPEADVLAALGPPALTLPEWPDAGPVYSRAQVDAAQAGLDGSAPPVWPSAREVDLEAAPLSFDWGCVPSF